MIKTPILSLCNGTTVTAMYPDSVSGTVLVSLSDGRLLKIDEISMLAGLAGDRLVYAQTMDGFGSISPVGSAGILYALHNRVIEINRYKEHIRWKEVVSPFSATSEEKVYGVFTSPVLWGGTDFGFWKGMYWDSETPVGTFVSVHARAAMDSTSLMSAPWIDMSPGSMEVENIERQSSSSSMAPVVSTTLFKSMDGFNQKGAYLQVRISMSTGTTGSTPSTSRLTVSYETKSAVYFFTQKFIMEHGSDIKNLFVAGRYSMPQNTEVRFGVAPTGSSDWNDYTVVEPGKLENAPTGTGDRFKMGIKLLSWDETAFPVVDEFAVVVGAEKDTLLNRT